jgi:hypothetical protein
VSITNTASQVSYTASGVQADFATTFRFLEKEHLVVELKAVGGNFVTQTLDVDYTVSGEDDDAGGTVTFATDPDSGAVVRITRTTPRTQEISFRNNGQSTFSPVLHERAADKLTMIAQEDDRRLEALEAGGTTVTLTPQTVTKTFAASEPVEDSFPLTVTCSGTPVGVILTRVENLTTPAELLRAEGLLWGSPVAGQFTTNFVEGLTPGQQYRFTFLVLT